MLKYIKLSLKIHLLFIIKFTILIYIIIKFILYLYHRTQTVTNLVNIKNKILQIEGEDTISNIRSNFETDNLNVDLNLDKKK